MRITNVRIRRIYETGARLRAIASITLDDAFAVHDLRVIEGDERLFVAMPSRKNSDGVFRDIVHPIGIVARAEIEQAVLTAYRAQIGAPPGLKASLLRTPQSA